MIFFYTKITKIEFITTFKRLISDLDNWDELSLENKKACLNDVEEMFEINLGLMLTTRFENSLALDQLFLRLSHPKISHIRYEHGNTDAYPFWRALSSMRAMKYLPDFKQVYLLMMEIICQINGVTFNAVDFLHEEDAKEYPKLQLNFFEGKSVNYQNIITKLELIFSEIQDKSKIAKILTVWRNHLATFFKLSAFALYEVYSELKNEKFPKYFLSEKEQAWLGYTQTEKEWVGLCAAFQVKYQQVCQNNPELLVLKPKINELFSYQSGDTLQTKQVAVYAFLSSSEAYPLLRCKRDILPISEKIRHFILKCLGLASGDNENKAYTLTQKSIFASKTHQLAFKIVEHIPDSAKIKT